MKKIDEEIRQTTSSLTESLKSNRRFEVGAEKGTDDK